MSKEMKQMVDFFVNSGNGLQAHGSVANRLLANGMNVHKMREESVRNDLLLWDEWKTIDRAVMRAYQQRMVGVADLQARNLTYNIPNGLGKPLFAYQSASDLEDAEISMDGKTRGRRDRPNFDIKYIPLPLIHKDFSFNIRELNASREGSNPLDTTNATTCGRKIGEKVEEMLFKGASTYTWGGGTIYGYEDYPHINSGSLIAGWADSDASGETILKDAVAMKQAAIDDRCYGPYMMYVPTVYETKLDEDFKAGSDKTIRQRLLEIQGIMGVKVSDKASSTKVTLVQLTEDVVRLITGMDIITVQWDVDGGMEVAFKVMAIQVPQIRSDQTEKCGVVVFSE